MHVKLRVIRTELAAVVVKYLKKDLHNFHLLYKEIQACQKSPSLN